MTRDDLITAFTMKVDGCSYAEIGEKYGVSRQRIEQLLKSSLGTDRHIFKYTHYKNLIQWLNYNGMSPTNFARCIHIAPELLRKQLRTGAPFTQKQIIAICKYTGLTFEQLIEGEE